MAFSTQNHINLLAYVLGSIRFSTAINILLFGVKRLCTWAQAHHH